MIPKLFIWYTYKYNNEYSKITDEKLSCNQEIKYIKHVKPLTK